MDFPQGLSLGEFLFWGGGCYFLLTQKVTKDALGDGSDEHLAKGGCS